MKYKACDRAIMLHTVVPKPVAMCEEKDL